MDIIPDILRRMWFYAALLASVVSGICIAISKKTLANVSPAVFYWATTLISTPFVVLLCIKTGLPELNRYFFIGVVGSVLLYNFSKIIAYKVIRDARLSSVYPIVALSPAFTLAASALPPLREWPGTLGAWGILVSIVGAYLLNVSSVRNGILEPFRILFRDKLAILMLISTAIVGIVSVADKIAITGTIPKNVIFVVLMEDILIVATVLPYLAVRHKNFLKEIRANFKPLLLVGTIITLSNVLGIFAIGYGNVAVVSAILKSHVFFLLLLGYFFFGDKPRTETMLGTIIMVLGIVLMKISS